MVTGPVFFFGIGWDLICALMLPVKENFEDLLIIYYIKRLANERKFGSKGSDEVRRSTNSHNLSKDFERFANIQVQNKISQCTYMRI